MFSISKFAVLLPFAGSAFASPLTHLESRQSTCKPNFQGNPVSIFVIDPNDYADNKIYEWYAENWNGSPFTLRSQSAEYGLQQGEFFVEFTGQPEQSHRIKLTADTSRDLTGTVSPSNEFILSTTVWSGTSQSFAFDCRHCGDDSRATHCQISHPASGQCITYAPGDLEGQRLVLGACDGSTPTFNVLPQLSAEDAAAVHIEDYLY